MKRLKSRNGSILQTYIILLFFIIAIILVVIAVITKYYITSKVMTVKRDLFYIGQNAAKTSLNIQKLSYSEYEIDENMIKKVANLLIESNYNGEVELEEIKFMSNEKKVYIKVMLKLNNMLPGYNNTIGIPIEETMKLKLMEVE